MEVMEFMAENPLVVLVCWRSWMDSGGRRATGLRFSRPVGLVLELGGGVNVDTGVGREPPARLVM